MSLNFSCHDVFLFFCWSFSVWPSFWLPYRFSIDFKLWQSTAFRCHFSLLSSLSRVSCWLFMFVFPRRPKSSGKNDIGYESAHQPVGTSFRLFFIDRCSRRKFVSSLLWIDALAQWPNWWPRYSSSTSSSLPCLFNSQLISRHYFFFKFLGIF